MIGMPQDFPPQRRVGGPSPAERGARSLGSRHSEVDSRAVVVDADGGTAGLVVRRREPRAPGDFAPPTSVGCTRRHVDDRKDSNASSSVVVTATRSTRRCRCFDGGHGRLEIDPLVLGRAVAELVEAREHGAAPELGSEADTNEHVVVEPQKVWTSFDPRSCHEGADVAGAQPVGAQPTRDVESAPGVNCVVAGACARAARSTGPVQDRGRSTAHCPPTRSSRQASRGTER